MVGYEPEVKVHLSAVEQAGAGAVSGLITRTLCQPLDVLKIRFQLQVEPIRQGAASKYCGLWQAVKRIVQEEGWTALWKGHLPAQTLSILYGISQFTSFELLTKAAWLYLPEEFTTVYRPITHAICGGLSGAMATLVIQPVDVIRTRFVAQGEPKTYKSVLGALASIVRNEGWGGLYRGLVPALSEIAPQAALQFGFYRFFTQAIRSAKEQPESSPLEPQVSWVCGASAGVLSKVVIYPLDIAKKRLQIQGFEKGRLGFGESRQYRGMTHCLACVLREEGVRGFYKGLSPSLIKAAAAAGFSFSVYEKVCALLISRRS